MSYSKEDLILICLSEMQEVTFAVKKRLYEDFTVNIPDLGKSKEYLIKTLPCGVYNKIEKIIKDPPFEKAKELESYGVECIPFYNGKYPERLKDIKNFPPLLYCKGNTDLLKEECFAIVGSRRTQQKVLTECKNLSAELSEKFVIVSGGATGADTAAAEGAKRSITVLAKGLSNVTVTKAKDDLYVSEYQPKAFARAYRFPERNRLIAALSKGVLVVSAAKKSGALITAGYAKEYKRELFSIPYSIGVESGEGCNDLIKSGAHLTTSAGDIFGVFGIDYFKKRVVLAPEQEKLYAEIKKRGEAHLSELGVLNIPIGKLLSLISEMEMAGAVIRLAGNKVAVCEI